MINDNENEAGNQKQITGYDLNRPRPRHGQKHTKYKICLSIMMIICIKQHISSIWSSIHEKVKQKKIYKQNNKKVSNK